MSLWLYTLTQKERIGGNFVLKSGERKEATSKNFKEVILNNTLNEKAWWGVANLYKSIKINDEVYINGSGYGLVGYATVLNKDDNEKRILLKFDLEECKKFIEAEIEFNYFEKFIIRRPRVLKAVAELDESIKIKINKDWLKKITPIETEIKEDSKDKIKASTRRGGTQEHYMERNHDLILMPLVKNYLKKQEFMEMKGIQRVFEGFIPDFLAVKGKRVLIVEGKTNNKGEGYNQARTAFGQVHDYLRLLKKQTDITNNYDLGDSLVAFENIPDERVIEFLEYYGIMLGWIENGEFVLSKTSEKTVKKYFL